MVGGRCGSLASTSLPYLSDTRLACHARCVNGDALPDESIVNIELVVATAQLLEAASVGSDALAAALGVDVAPGWPEFPAAIPAALAFLEIFEEQAQWSMYFFVDTQTRTLVGSGGFKGAPLDGMVEIGYEIAPDWRGRGCATAAARALVERARASGLVTRVVAETLPEANASGSVLRKVGFVRVGEASDPDVGVTWRWELIL